VEVEVEVGVVALPRGEVVTENTRRRGSPRLKV
jgi:hypothetical protein